MKAYELFDSVIKKGAGMLFIIEDLNDPEEEARRLSICESNAGICYNAKRDKCKHCTCYMSVKVTCLKNINPQAFGRVEITHCPLANWGGEQEKEIANYYRTIDKKPLLV